MWLRQAGRAHKLTGSWAPVGGGSLVATAGTGRVSLLPALPKATLCTEPVADTASEGGWGTAPVT